MCACVVGFYIYIYDIITNALTQERHIAHNLCSRLSALGLTCATTEASEQFAPSVILMDEVAVLDDANRYPGVAWIAVGRSRPSVFEGEFLRKPIRSKQLIDALRRSFKVPPIGECAYI